LVAWEGEASTRLAQIHHHLPRGRAIVLGDSHLRHEHVKVFSASGASQTLPGASVVVNGVTPAKNSALTSIGAELRLANGVSLLAKFDGEFRRPLLDLCRHRHRSLHVVARSG